MNNTNVKTARNYFLLAVLLLVGLYFFPLWSITLAAPQYPEPLTMYISIDKITGKAEGTLQNINIMNHYVGMKKIEPESIPELKYMPKIIGVMILLGLIIAYTKKPSLYLSWIILFILLGLVGLYDFNAWNYDFGHDLNPNAPIKLDTDYQPPLFGHRKILNFDAYSYPYIASYFAMASILLASFSWYKVKKALHE